MYRVLLVEDDSQIREVIGDYFGRRDKIILDFAEDGERGLSKILNEQYDLILLDVMMPGLDGFELCKIIRRRSDIPVVFLTGKVREEDVLYGYELGADDYIVKPFSPREVIARVKAVLRRFGDSPKPSSVLSFTGLEINLNNYSVKSNGESVPCTPKEVEILYLLASHPGQVFGRDQILEAVWGIDYNGDSRTVDTHIKRIRQKITYNNAPWSIQTIYGIGYKFEVS